ncbi:hypothetical protein [Microvirga sp. BSC39]|uniref:hypothetical protein n=1 Tax=Microvirga sp. BSC39 TaxID=1549810 RepID=UPI0004E9805E|nr:hypothetical protein [Microvirga sp. BSC39]KFG69989.1 hypothetical protein JH26_07550 [Microvirga sp. BSC39]
MAYRFVTGIDTDGEVLAGRDSLTVGTGTAIRVAAAGVNGIFSSAFGTSATVFGDVAAAGDGIRLTGDESAVFIGRSGTVTGGGTGVSLGSSLSQEISFRNEGTITGYGVA